MAILIMKKGGKSVNNDQSRSQGSVTDLCFAGATNILNTNNREMYGKTQIVTRRFRMRLHASNFSIQFHSRNIKVFSSYLF